MNDSEMCKESNSGIDLYIETAPNVKLYERLWSRKVRNSYSYYRMKCGIPN
jgi:hypothetical protein